MDDIQTLFDSDEAENEYMQEIARKAEKRAIEDMAREMCCAPCACEECAEAKVIAGKCLAQSYATIAIKKNYRKQRTAQWVTIAETEDGVIVRYTHRCTDCNYFYKTVCPRGDDYCHKCGARMKRRQ